MHEAQPLEPINIFSMYELVVVISCVTQCHAMSVPRKFPTRSVSFQKIIVTIENLSFFFNLKHKHLKTCLTIKGIRIEQQFSLYERVGGIGSFDHFLARFSAFHGTKNVRFLCLLRFQFYFALSFWFSTKIKSGFRICYSVMRFDVFPQSRARLLGFC